MDIEVFQGNFMGVLIYYIEDVIVQLNIRYMFFFEIYWWQLLVFVVFIVSFWW